MRHPRIVNLTDVFEICCDSFATVLDYCRGTDLECLLRERKQLPERDARALILQVARGLQYLNTAQARSVLYHGIGFFLWENFNGYMTVKCIVMLIGDIY